VAASKDALSVPTAPDRSAHDWQRCRAFTDPDVFAQEAARFEPGGSQPYDSHHMGSPSPHHHADLAICNLRLTRPRRPCRRGRCRPLVP
jgi:hypothetical protein